MYSYFLRPIFGFLAVPIRSNCVVNKKLLSPHSEKMFKPRASQGVCNMKAKIRLPWIQAYLFPASHLWTNSTSTFLSLRFQLTSMDSLLHPSINLLTKKSAPGVSQEQCFIRFNFLWFWIGALAGKGDGDAFFLNLQISRTSQLGYSRYSATQCA